MPACSLPCLLTKSCGAPQAMYDQERSLLYHMVASVKSVFKQENPDAFHYPQRVISAVFISISTNATTFVLLYNYAITLYEVRL